MPRRNTATASSMRPASKTPSAHAASTSRRVFEETEIVLEKKIMCIKFKYYTYTTQ